MLSDKKLAEDPPARAECASRSARVMCQTCGREYTSRECSDPEHRAARGYAADSSPSDSNFRTCPRCRERKPIEKFWTQKRNRDTGRPIGRGYLAKRCSQCLWELRARRPSKLRKKALNRKIRTESDAFWAHQRSEHLESRPDTQPE